MAIVGSEFDRILWVDSDAYMLRNFSYISSLTNTGTLFWHDVHKTSYDNPIWRVCNITPIQFLAQESGLVYYQKSMRWRSLYVAAYMNQKQNIYYAMLWGDKDTFHLACAAMGEPYTFVPYGSFMVGKTTEELRQDLGISLPAGEARGYLFCQPDTEGRALFVHGKAKVDTYAREGKKLFSVVISYDGNTEHVEWSGELRYAVKNEGGKGGTYHDSNVALGDYEKHFTQAFLEGERFYNEIK